jgi:hypothetical protein
MKKRSMGLVLVGLLFVGSVPFAVSGCGHSLVGDCSAVCHANCDAGDACENYTGFPKVDKEDCNDKCQSQCEDFADQTSSQCNDHVDIHGDRVDSCVNALNHLQGVCNDDNESEIPEATKDSFDECVGQTLYQCN